jgi:short-subunit dehydrogenase
MSTSKRIVLITGCSDGGLGAALAIAFHEAGMQVYATARSTSKMSHLESLGIETLELDVLSDSSIAACVSKISSLDILVNNAGAMMTMPATDISIPEAKKLFDINVWSYLAMTQAFLPLLLQSSKGMIVNQTSISSVISVPFQSAYSASKAAIAMLSNGLRLELQGFGITVVDLKTAVVKSNLIQNNKEMRQPVLPKGSIYEPAKELVERSLRQDEFLDAGMNSREWARLVTQDLLRKNPPPNIWRGEQAILAWVSSILPFGFLDATVKKMTGLDIVEKMVRK